MKRFKDRVDLLAASTAAARKRVQDQDHETLNSKDVDRLVVRLLGQPSLGAEPSLLPGTVLNSQDYRRYLKDMKFFVNMIGSQTSALETLVRSSNRESFGSLSEVQNELAAVESLVTEEEIKVYGGWRAAHYNAFVRSEDLDIGEANNSWLVDWKTDLPFLPENISTVVPGVGLTLPVNAEEVIPIVDVVLLGESSDYGDTLEPLISTSPRGLLIPGQTFRHIIVKKEYSNAGFRYPRSSVAVTLQLEMGGIVLINKLSLTPTSSIPFQVTGIIYIGDAGEEVELPYEAVTVNGKLIVLFEPVRTRYLRVTFSQHTSVTKSVISQESNRIQELNRLLRGAGFSTLLHSPTEMIQGRVHDFSMESLKIFLCSYEGLGVFRSQPLYIHGLRGIGFQKSIDMIEPANEFRFFGETLVTPDEVIQEAYIGITLRDTKSVRLSELFPVPDAKTTQTEYLTTTGRYSRVKLFPDMRSHLVKFRVLTAEVGVNHLIVTTDADHGFSVNDYVEFYGPIEHRLNGRFKVTHTPSPTTFKIFPNNPSAFTVDVRQVPYTYVYGVADQDNPFTVYENGEELDIRHDYQVSLDGGSSWLDRYPMSGDYNALLREAQAGSFMIRLIAPVAEHLYWIVYPYAANQSLVPGGLISMVNGAVVVAPELANMDAALTVVLVSRSNTANPFNTSITNHYTLQVR